MARLYSEPANFDRGGVQQRFEVRKDAGKSGSNVVDGLALQSASLESMIESLRKAIAGNMQRTLNLFREWDSDCNGCIEREEFAHALSVLGLETNASVATALFDALDDDHNGALEFSELHSKLRQRIDVAARRKAKRQQDEARKRLPTPRSHSQAAHAGASSVLAMCRKALAADLRRTVDLFRAWDSDGSGMIDKREFGLALGSLVPDASPEVCNALFDVFDVDRSGTLEYYEIHQKLRAGGRGAQRKQMAPQRLTSRIHAMQDDVVGRVRTRTRTDATTDHGMPPLTALLPATERRPPNLPPRPTLPQTSPARHRRVGKRLPINRQRGAGTQEEADKASPAIKAASHLGQASFHLPPLPAIQQGLKYHWH